MEGPGGAVCGPNDGQSRSCLPNCGQADQMRLNNAMVRVISTLHLPASFAMVRAERIRS